MLVNFFNYYFFYNTNNVINIRLINEFNINLLNELSSTKNIIGINMEMHFHNNPLLYHVVSFLKCGNKFFYYDNQTLDGKNVIIEINWLEYIKNIKTKDNLNNDLYTYINKLYQVSIENGYIKYLYVFYIDTFDNNYINNLIYYSTLYNYEFDDKTIELLEYNCLLNKTDYYFHLERCVF